MTGIPEYGSVYEWTGTDMASTTDITVVTVFEQESDTSWVVTVTQAVDNQ